MGHEQPRTGLIMANLVLGSNGASTLGGRSAPLSSGIDRGRFHALRGSADYIVIGGNTARCEPYEKTPCPLIIATRTMEMGRARENPLAQMDSRPIETILSELRADGQRALIEAGVSLLHIAIQAGLVDEFYLTLSTVEGDGNFFNRNVLEESFALTSEEILNDEGFQLWTKR